MRDTSLEDRLRSDAPAWRDAVAARPVGRTATPRGGQRLPGWASPLVAAAAAVAVAGVIWLRPPAPAPDPAPAPSPDALVIRPPMPVDLAPRLLTPAELADWLPGVSVMAPSLPWAEAEAFATAPIRRETDRLRGDVANAVGFVLTLVPAAPADDPARHGPA